MVREGKSEVVPGVPIPPSELDETESPVDNIIYSVYYTDSAGIRIVQSETMCKKSDCTRRIILERLIKGKGLIRPYQREHDSKCILLKVSFFFF